MKPQLTDMGYEVNAYIKTHNKTGMRYFGQTSKKDVDKYQGSGVVWTDHLKAHGYDCKTVVVLTTRFKEELTTFCQSFSEQMGIADAEDWANMKPENGMDGAKPGTVLSKEHVAKIVASHKGRVNSPESIAKMRAAHMGHEVSIETRKKISDKLTGTSLTEEAKAKISAANKGRKLSAQTIANMKASAKCGKESHMYGLLPWKSHRTQNPHSQLCWGMLEEGYKWWLSVNHKSYGSGPLSLMNYLKEVSEGTSQSMIKYFRKFPNGSWFDSDDYIDWKSWFNK